MKKVVLAVGFLCGAFLGVLVLGPVFAHAQENTDPNAQAMQLLRALGIPTGGIPAHQKPTPPPPCTFWAAQGCQDENHFSWSNETGCWLVSTTSLCTSNGFNNCLQTTTTFPATAEECGLLNGLLQGNVILPVAPPTF
jgi:hypothetical protein